MKLSRNRGIGLNQPRVTRAQGLRTAADVSLAEWTQRVGYVPQDPRLLSATVAENIRFYRRYLSDADVVAAAKQAHVHDEIMALPDGYDTTIGQRADAVSGGQRQRLCIARALAGRPDFLILDEPTSALDVRSESLVQESLKTLHGEFTLLIVAHRLSTLNICDRIMVIVNGVVEAFESPNAVLQTNAFYRQAVELSHLKVTD
jgi:ATP-binding cassette subfamily B protein